MLINFKKIATPELNKSFFTSTGSQITLIFFTVNEKYTHTISQKRSDSIRINYSSNNNRHSYSKENL